MASSRLCLVVAALVFVASGARRAAGQDAAGQGAVPSGAPGVAAPAAAASAATPLPDARAQAKERFVRGVALAKAGAWDPALAEFLASRALFPTRVALENAAISLRELRRFVEARAMYAELLASFGANLSPEEHAIVSRQMQELDAFIGALTIESNPSGAKVVLDGVERGATPLAGLRVSSGSHALRLSKPGYERFEAQLTIAGREQKRVSAALQPLRRIGTLLVREASGRRLDVAVDGAVVGVTPWQGTLSPGVHSVALGSASGLGTAPSSARVRENEAVTLVLRAEPLDSVLRVEPLPSNARVFLDGVDVGSGIWQGRLKSGAHRVEVAAEAHVPFIRDVTLQSGRTQRLAVTLERDLSHPSFRTGFTPHAYVEALGGPLLLPSFGGGAEAACGAAVRDLEGSGQSGCRDRDRPFGFLAGARVGYLLRERLGLELFIGYLSLQAEQTRRLRVPVTGAVTELYSDRVLDKTRVRGPLAALSASYALPSLPVGLRLWAGMLRASVETSNSGMYVGESAAGGVERLVSIAERDQQVWVPMIGPELWVRHRFTRSFALAAGVTSLLLLPGETPRTGARSNGLVTARGERKIGLVDVGNVALPEEDALGVAFAVFPSLSAQLDF